jgi:hypothetical protein
MIAKLTPSPFDKQKAPSQFIGGFDNAGVKKFAIPTSACRPCQHCYVATSKAGSMMPWPMALNYWSEANATAACMHRPTHATARKSAIRKAFDDFKQAIAAVDDSIFNLHKGGSFDGRKIRHAFEHLHVGGVKDCRLGRGV